MTFTVSILFSWHIEDGIVGGVTLCNLQLTFFCLINGKEI